MKRIAFVVFVTVAMAICMGISAPQVQAQEVNLSARVNLYVDSAPNIYGSPDYAGWQTNAWSTAADGTFENMANSVNSANAGTNNFEMEDAVVYSFDDLGQRLHFVYWVPGETVTSLTGRFEVALFYDWDGVRYDFYNDYYGTTWITPAKWQNYDSDGDGQTDGVIGTSGMAWWGAKDVNTMDALLADIAEWDLYQGNFYFYVRLDECESEIIAYHTPSAVPIPGALWLLGSGLVGLAGLRRKVFK